MTRDVVFRPEAAAEVLEVRRWYEARRANLGDEFVAEVERLVDRIATNPLAFRQVHGEIRRAVLARFPYAIYFRPMVDVTVVLAIHGRQDPSRWQGRS